jgi:hypothetical protein
MSALVCSGRGLQFDGRNAEAAEGFKFSCIGFAISIHIAYQKAIIWLDPFGFLREFIDVHVKKHFIRGLLVIYYIILKSNTIGEYQTIVLVSAMASVIKSLTELYGLSGGPT